MEWDRDWIPESEFYWREAARHVRLARCDSNELRRLDYLRKAEWLERLADEAGAGEDQKT